MYRLLSCLFCLSIFALSAAEREPLLRAVDLDIGEIQTVELADGSESEVKLLDLQETVDNVTGAVRQARVTVEVNGERVKLDSANYHLPVKVAGVQIDCPVTSGYNKKGTPGFWGLEKDARLRLWPGNSPLIAPNTFIYPVKQKWFATDTQMANEPVYVDGGERPGKEKIYYHSGLDIGGSEGRVPVVAATDGLVVSAGGLTLEDHKIDTPVSPRYDVVYILDERGWYYRYSHLKEIDESIKPGREVKMADRVGILGKEGGSGGWSHLHFEIKSRQPSGEWGTQEGYAFLWEAYRRQYRPPLIAVARPHHLLWTGETVTLDASESWSAHGDDLRFEWQFGDGSSARGAQVTRTYEKPGRHSEVVRVTDQHGNVAYDFAVVIVYDRDHPDRHITTIHPNYAPTFDIKAGDPVTFKVRSFSNPGPGREIWDFGDDTPLAMVQSDGNEEKLAPDGYAEVVHRFEEPGNYIVRVERINEHGVKATGHLWVEVK